MSKTIFRTVKNPDNPFVMIDKRPIENPKLSWKSKGLLTYLMSRPDNWIVRFRDLVKRSTDGPHAVRAAVRELREAGHIVVEVEREGGKVVRWTYAVYEEPLRGFQQVEKQEVENRTLSNTKSTTKKDYTKKGDILDGMLEAEREAKIRGMDKVEETLCRLDRAFRATFARSTRSQSIARFIMAREKEGESLDAFVQWAKRDEFNASRTYEYAEFPEKIRTRWPQAFAAKGTPQPKSADGSFYG